jgi:hypothetical protein
LHPLAEAAGYGHLTGASLECRQQKPSRTALVARWSQFRDRCGSAQ